MKEALGLSDDQIIVKWNIPEDETAQDAAMDLADQGCNIVFANSFGHESYIIEAAKEYPEVQFCHATGFQAASSGLPNMHNYFTSVYESRYVSGVVAGLKLNQMIDEGKITEDTAKIGYVALTHMQRLSADTPPSSWEFVPYAQAPPWKLSTPTAGQALIWRRKRPTL